MINESYLRPFGVVTALLFAAVAHGQPLDTLLARVWADHPSLAALGYAYEAQLRVGPQRSRLPDPELQLGYWLLPVETRTGPQRLRAGATQRLPYPGRLEARRQLAETQAAPLKEQRAARALQLAFELRRAYFDGWRIAARAERLAAFQSVYALLEQATLARIETGQGSTVGAYQVALEQQALNYRLAALRAQAAVPRSIIGGLLAAPPAASINYQLPDYRLDTAAVRRVAASLSTTHPRLRLFAAQLAVREASLALNELALKPDFTLGLDYVQVNTRDDAAPAGNGRDILGPRVGVRLPLDKSAYRAKREEETLRSAQLRADRAALLLDLQTRIETTLTTYRLAVLEAAFIQQQLNTLPPALEVARAEYGEGRRPLEEVLRLEERVLDYRLQEVDVRHRRAGAVARLAFLLAVHPSQITVYE